MDVSWESARRFSADETRNFETRSAIVLKPSAFGQLDPRTPDCKALTLETSATGAAADAAYS
jgi:hypothetical protein